MTAFLNLLRETLRLGWDHRAELAELAAAHLDLVVESVGIASAIAVPLGILASRSRPVERVVVGAANVLQTVPSLALLGFLLVLFGGAIGKAPSLAALVIYSLLPILKNTVLGLRGVDRGTVEAAEGMGMTGWQRLRLVELPLAVPVILGGVRVAAVAAVGMATIAAFIGARGLGNYIQRGLSTLDARWTLLGAIPAAMLALGCDAALGELERAIDPKAAKGSRLRGIVAGLAIAVLLGLALWGATDGWRPGRAAEPPEAAPDGQAGEGRREIRTVVVGSKDGGEMILLGHMLADLIEAKTDLNVRRTMNLGGTMIAFQAMKAGGPARPATGPAGWISTSSTPAPPSRRS